jgi:hypothetical protein
MNKESTKQADVSVPQSVTEFIKLQTDSGAIQIGFTEQKVSPHAGLASLVGFLHWHRVSALLGRHLPHRPRSNHAHQPSDTAMAFLIGIIGGARKLAQVAYLRGDRLLQQLLQVQDLPSQPTLSRFFRRFDGAAVNQKFFSPLWRWSVERLNSRAGGYTLDLDSTHLIHEDHHRAQGVASGYTPLGIKPCWHPLMGFLEEAKVVCGFWLRPGNTATSNNVVAFTLNILEALPHHVGVGLVRADAGFCAEEWLGLLEDKRLKYIVVAKLREPVRALLRKHQQWQQTEITGTEVSEVDYQAFGWRAARRLILIRHRQAQKGRPAGKELLEVPGYTFQVLVTNLEGTLSPLAVWRRYNGRAGCEGVIKELGAHFALGQLCLENFWSSEAALGLAIWAYNLCILFQRHLGWQDRVNAATLRFRLFVTAGIVSQTGGRKTIRLAVAPRQRPWWRRLLEKIVCPYPNCNSVEPWPEPAGH